MSNDIFPSSFANNQPPTVSAGWFNDVMAAVWGAIGTGRGGIPPVTPADVRTNIGVPSLSQLVAANGATLVGFQANGTGAAVATVASKLLQIVCLQDFTGVDPLGSADSTTGCQNAINYVEGLPNGGSLYTGAGAFSVTALTITSQLLLWGCGFGVSKIYARDGTSDVITITGASVTIRDLGFGAGVTRTAGRYINCTSTSSLVAIEDCYMIGWFTGIDFEGAGDFSVVRTKLVNGVPVTGTAIAIGTGSPPSAGAPSSVHLTNVTVDNPAGSKPFSAVSVGQCGEVSLIACELQHCLQPLYVAPAGVQVVASFYAVKTFFDNAGNYGAIFQPQAAGASIVKAQLISCWSSSATTFDGLFFDTNTHGGTIDGVDIIGHEALLNGRAGITLTGTGTINIRVLGGKFGGNTSAGIAVQANVGQFAVQDARCGPTGAAGANGTYGIQVLAGSSNNYQITNNDVRGNTTAGISDAGTGTTKQVYGNLGYNPTGQVQVMTNAATGTTYQNLTGAPVRFVLANANAPTGVGVLIGGVTLATAAPATVPMAHGETVTVNFSGGGPVNAYIWGLQ